MSFLLLLASALALSATGNAPPLIGQVRDSSGGPLAEVTVVIASLNRSTTTNDEGRFTFTGLPAGTYHLTALMIGRAPGHADVVIPSSGPPVQVTIVMGPVRTIRLSTVQVTATPTGTDPRDVAQSTTGISGPELSRGLAPSVAASLSNEPGIAVRFNGPAAAPVIRGLSGERVLVLQDGARAADLSTTSADHAVSLDPLTAQRIEVVRGPASLLYGNNALGGVVNVISNDLPTELPSHTDGFVNTQAESATPGGALAAGVTVPLSSSLAFVARVGARRADDLRMGGSAVLRNSFNRSLSGSGGVALSRPSITGGIIARGYTFEYGLPSADNDGIRIEGYRYEGSARAESATPVSFFTSMKFSGTSQWYGHDEVEPGGEIGTRFELRTQTLDLLGRTEAGSVTGAVGVAGLFRQYAATGEEALTPGANSNGLGFFVFQEIPVRPLDDPHARVPRLQLGGRYDFYGIASQAGDPKFGPARDLTFNNVSGSVGVNVPVTPDVTLAASVARAFRAPTVEELFSNAFHAAIGTFDVGNPNLKVETNQGADAILRVASGRASGEFSGYYSRIANYIAPEIVKDTTIVDPESGSAETVPLSRFRQADATLRGVEGRLEYEIVRRVVIGVMGDMVRAAFPDGTPLPFIPPARIGGLARFDDGRWSWTADYRRGSAQNRVPSAISARDPAAVATEAYDLVNLSAGISFAPSGHISSVLLRVDNALDERYRDATSRIKRFAFSPGRNISVVYRMMF